MRGIRLFTPEQTGRRDRDRDRDPVSLGERAQLRKARDVDVFVSAFVVAVLIVSEIDRIV